MGSPPLSPSPLSPPPSRGGASGHTERLPNKLLDELWEDIGVKTGEDVELDFVEFLMGQDGESHSFVTPEGVLPSRGALLSSGSSGSSAGGGGGNVSAASSNISTPSNSSGSACVTGEGQSYSKGFMGPGVASSNTAVSSESNSPAAKRIHLSMSANNSPEQQPQRRQWQEEKPQQRLQPPQSFDFSERKEKSFNFSQQNPPQQPPFSSHHHHHHQQVPSPSCSLQAPSTTDMFKMPPTPPTPRQSVPGRRGSPSLHHKDMGRSSPAVRAGSVSPGLAASPRPTVKEETGSRPGSGQFFASSLGDGVSRNHHYPTPPPTSQQFSSCDVAQGAEGGVRNNAVFPHHQPQPHHVAMHPQQNRYSGVTQTQGLMPKDVNPHPVPSSKMKNFPPVRWGASASGYPSQPYPHPGKGMYRYPYQGPHGMDSPRDPGYFSNESAGNGTLSTVASPALTTSSVSSRSLTSTVPLASVPNLAGQQKSVHFDDRANQNGRDLMSGMSSRASVGMGGYGHYPNNPPHSDFTFGASSTQWKDLGTGHQDSKLDTTSCALSSSSSETRGMFGSYDQSACVLADQGGAERGSSVTGSVSGYNFASHVGEDVPDGDAHFNHQGAVRAPASPRVDLLKQGGTYPTSSNFNPPADTHSLPVNLMRTAQQRQQSCEAPQRHSHRRQEQNQLAVLPNQTDTLKNGSDKFSSCSYQSQSSHGFPSHKDAGMNGQGLSASNQQVSSMRVQVMNNPHSLNLNGQESVSLSSQPGLSANVNSQGVSSQQGVEPNSQLSVKGNAQPVLSNGQSGMSNLPNVNMSGQPNVNMSGQPNVNMSGQPNVNMSGQPNVNSRPNMNISNQASVNISCQPHMNMNSQPDMNTNSQMNMNGQADMKNQTDMNMNGQLDQSYRPTMSSQPNVNMNNQPALDGNQPSMTMGMNGHPQHRIGMGPSDAFPPHSTPHAFQPAGASTPMSRGPLQHTGRPPVPGPGGAFRSVPPAHSFHGEMQPPASLRGPMYPQHQQPGPVMSPRGGDCPPHFLGPSPSPHAVPDHGIMQPDMKAPHPHYDYVPLPHPGPCAGNPTCPGCAQVTAVNQPGPASKAFSSRQGFIQHLIMDEGNSAYRSHPLFPLLRDLVIAGMNFEDPRFHYQQLLSMLPHDFDKLLQNFLQRNPPAGNYQSNNAVESVLMDCLRLSHGNLVGESEACVV